MVFELVFTWYLIANPLWWIREFFLSNRHIQGIQVSTEEDFRKDN